MNLKFFKRLHADPEFCAQLGQVTLAAGRFESNLRAYLILRGVKVSERGATFGTLIKKLKDNGLLSENGVQVLRDLKEQRNYLTHCLFDLFSARVDETLLPRSDLVPMDVALFTEKAWELEQNLSGLDRIVEKEIDRPKVLKPGTPIENQLLFRP